MKMGDATTDFLATLGADPNAYPAQSNYVTAPVDMTSTIAPQPTDAASAPNSIDWTKLLSTGLSVFGQVSQAQAQSATAQAAATMASRGVAPAGYAYSSTGQLYRTSYATPGYLPTATTFATTGTSSNLLLWGGAALLGLLLVFKMRG